MNGSATTNLMKDLYDVNLVHHDQSEFAVRRCFEDTFSSSLSISARPAHRSYQVKNCKDEAFTLLGIAIASPAAVQAFDSVDHDQVRPFEQPEPSTTKEKVAVKYNPQLHITDGCHPYPAVEADGSVSAGLEWSGDDDGDCKRSPWGSQVYSRGGSHNGKYAIMYAWYFPKGKGHSHKHHDGHRHDWEFAIVWLNRPSANESAIVGVMTSISDDFHHEVPLQPEQVVGSSVKLDSYSTYWGAKQGLRLTKKTGEFQDLIQWEQLTDAARAALNGADFNTDNARVPVEVPFKDNVFQEKLVDSYPF